MVKREDVLARCVVDACAYVASNAGWDDYGTHRDRIAAEYRELEAAEGELIQLIELLRRCSVALRVGECDMHYHDKQGVRRSLQEQLAAALARVGGGA